MQSSSEIIIQQHLGCSLFRAVFRVGSFTPRFHQTKIRLKDVRSQEMIQFLPLMLFAMFNLDPLGRSIWTKNIFFSWVDSCLTTTTKLQQGLQGFRVRWVGIFWQGMHQAFGVHLQYFDASRWVLWRYHGMFQTNCSFPLCTQPLRPKKMWSWPKMTKNTKGLGTRKKTSQIRAFQKFQPNWLVFSLSKQQHKKATFRQLIAMLRRSTQRCCDLYAALGVRPSASQGELREAYLRMAKQHHPDVTWRGVTKMPGTWNIHL